MPAIGQSVGSLDGQFWAGALSISSREIWVRPNTDPSRDCTHDFLDAIETARQRVEEARGREFHPFRPVRVKPGYYNLLSMTEPLWFPPGVGMIGGGRDTVIQQSPNSQFPTIISGLGEPNCTAADRPDLFGIMDASFCPTPGARRGMSGVNGKSVFFEHNDLNLGALNGMHSYWETVSYLNLDMAYYVTNASGVLPAGSVIAGMGEQTGGDATPWQIFQSYTLNNAIILQYASSARKGEYAGSDGNITIYLPPGTGRLVRLSVQLDLANKTCHAWINQVKCQVAATFGAGGTFRDNADWPLHLGRTGRLGGVTTDLMFCGLRIGSAPRFATGGATGSTQTRTNGAPVNDAYIFLEGEGRGAGLVGYCDFSDPVSSRYLTTIDGRGLPNKGFIATSVGGDLPVQFKNFVLFPAATGILLGTVIDFEAEGLYVNAVGGPAIGSVAAAVSYPVKITRCVLGSSHAAVYANGWDGRLEQCDFPRIGRYGVLARGSSMSIKLPAVGAVPPDGQCVAAFSKLSGEYGGPFVVDGGVVDNEGGVHFRNAVVEVYGRRGTQTFSHVTVRELYSAASSLDPPVGVRLRSVTQQSRSTYSVPESNIWDQAGTANVVADAGWLAV